ncbi:MAG: L-threonylcarbamoyladenylate synthase [Oscillospiraceae bacterium]
MSFKTEILDNSSHSTEIAARLLKDGKVVGIPTETVYGLAANAFDENAVAEIFKAKGRPSDNPLIVHISSMDMLSGLVSSIPDNAKKCAEKFWPGPLTMIMPKSDKIPMITSGGLQTVGIRMPSHKIARRIIEACGFPLAAPSANLSGSPSPTTAKHVFNDMNGRIPCIIDGGFSAVGVESTVISFEGDSIRLLRPGFISVEDLKEVTENVIIDNGVLHMLKADATVASPGMKYKHYSPKADITIIDSDLTEYRQFISEHKEKDLWCMTFNDSEINGIDVPCISYGSTSEQQAHLLFEVLREFDRVGAKKVYARCPVKTGVGLAVYNRLLRAAGFQVISI